MRKLGALVVVCGFASAAFADAIDLPLATEDSITIDGNRYTCGGSHARGGVKMSGGDVVTAGRFRLRCVAPAGGATQPPPPPPLSTARVTSQVSATCIAAMSKAASGYMKPEQGAAWANACRNLTLSDRCRDVTSKHDTACFAAIEKAASGYISGANTTAVQNACKIVEGECPAAGKKATSSVDATCIQQLYKAATGYPKFAQALEWVDSCRNAVARRCVPISGTFDGNCMTAATKIMSSYPTADEVPQLAQRCRQIEFRCD